MQKLSPKRKEWEAHSFIAVTVSVAASPSQLESQGHTCRWEAQLWMTSGDALWSNFWIISVKSPLQKKLISRAVQRTVFCGFFVIGGLQLHWGQVEVAASCSRGKHIHTHTEHSMYRDGRRTHSNWSASNLWLLLIPHFLQSGVLVVPLSREAATQGSKQFEVQHILIYSHLFIYFTNSSETEDKKVLPGSTERTRWRGPCGHRHSNRWGQNKVYSQFFWSRSTRLKSVVWVINSQEKMHLVNNGCAALTIPIVIRWNNCHFAGSTSPPLISEKRISGILLGHSFCEIEFLVKFKMIRLEWLGQGWLSCPGVNTQALQPQRCHFNYNCL